MWYKEMYFYKAAAQCCRLSGGSAQWRTLEEAPPTVASVALPVEIKALRQTFQCDNSPELKFMQSIVQARTAQATND